MDGFVTHRIEGVPVDIEVVAVAPHAFTARFRVFGDAGDAPGWHVVHVTDGPFDTEQQAEEAAKSAALAQILARGERRDAST